MKLSDVFFKKNLDNNELWVTQINMKYIIAIWVSKGAICSPKVSDLPIDDYTHVEMDIFHHDGKSITLYNQIFSKDLKKLGVDLPPRGGSHFHNIPVEDLFKAMKALGLKQIEILSTKILEAKCKYCGRMNDIGVATCWHCCKTP